ncbi:hypothetical protein BD413DRAFT_542435 [Trametes elegans]|nr:hypothetical protein BD413DRAFT_542435 [Trametes elegans]
MHLAIVLSICSFLPGTNSYPVRLCRIPRWRMSCISPSSMSASMTSASMLKACLPGVCPVVGIGRSGPGVLDGSRKGVSARTLVRLGARSPRSAPSKLGSTSHRPSGSGWACRTQPGRSVASVSVSVPFAPVVGWRGRGQEAPGVHRRPDTRPRR